MRLLVRLVVAFAANAFLVLAGFLATRVAFAFFGNLAQPAWMSQVMAYTTALVPRFGLARIATPYRGILDLNVGASLGAVVACEWVTTFTRRFVG